MSNFTDLIASAVERLCDKPCEGDVDVSGCSVLVPPLLDQRHHLGVGEAEEPVSYTHLTLPTILLV